MLLRGRVQKQRMSPCLLCFPEFPVNKMWIQRSWSCLCSQISNFKSFGFLSPDSTTKSSSFLGHGSLRQLKIVNNWIQSWHTVRQGRNCRLLKPSRCSSWCLKNWQWGNEYTVTLTIWSGRCIWVKWNCPGLYSKQPVTYISFYKISWDNWSHMFLC